MFDVIIKCDEPICGLIENGSRTEVYEVRRRANEETTEMLIYHGKAGWMWIDAKHCIPVEYANRSPYINNTHAALVKCKTDVQIIED